MADQETIEMEHQHPSLQLSEEEAKLVRAYMLFSNGEGLLVYEDLMAAFYYFESEGFNEELQEIPDPYREYVKAGCRMVIDKIRLITKQAEQMR